MPQNIFPSSQPVSNTIIYTNHIKPSSTGECDLVGVGSETTLGPGSFTFGLIFGIVIILIIFIILYVFRGLFFSEIPTNYTTCTSNEYYNDPAIALAKTGVHANDILYVQNGQLFYKRVPITRSCVPGTDQTILINYPQYCLFERQFVESANLDAKDNDTFVSDQQFSSSNPPPDGFCNLKFGVGKTHGVAPHNTQASYMVQNWQTSVSAGPNCVPISGAEFGQPLARWDPFP